jgi:hypothetical protein
MPQEMIVGRSERVPEIGDASSAQVHIDLRKLAAVKEARDALREAAEVRCTCSGVVIQYEGGCCCESGRGKRAAKARLKQAIDAL